MKTRFSMPALIFSVMVAVPAFSSAVASRSSVNERAERAIDALDHSVLAVAVDQASPRLRPGAEVSLYAAVYNGTASPASDLKIRVALPDGSTFLSLDGADASKWSCDADGASVLCQRVEPLSSHVTDRFGLGLRLSADPAGGNAVVRVALISGTAEVSAASTTLEIHRTWRVTTTRDSGDGSLRQAITEANSQCRTNGPERADGPVCSIVFNIPDPVPASGWYTIRPREPLVVTVSDLVIDATTQTAATGDTNPYGPEIELDGSLQGEGSGIVIGASCELQIRGLAIHSFPEDGIRISETATNEAAQNPRSLCAQSRFRTRSISENYLGTDPTGLLARANGLRGISSTAPGAVDIHITDNLISGNRRSGVFIWQGTGYRITGNRIGARRDEILPLPNGASGIYVGGMAGLVSSQQILIENNFITFNEHWGIAIDVSDNPAAEKLVRIGPNVIHSNHNPAIDLKLDLALVNEGDEPRLVRPPVILSAIYSESTDTTIIEGTVVPQSRPIPDWQRFAIDVYSSTNAGAYGHGEAESHVGRVTLETASTFRLEVRGDQTGRFISATATVVDLFAGNGWTSELSRPVRVTH